MPGFELLTEEFEHALGLSMEESFGTSAAPAIWVPGQDELEYDDGIEEVELPIGEWEPTHIARRRVNLSGSMNFQICPGQEAIYIGAAGMLSRRTNDRKRLRSFSAVRVQGNEGYYYNGLTVNTYNVRCGTDQDLVIETDVRGVNREIGAAPQANYANLAAPYVLQELQVWVDSLYTVSFDSVEIRGDHSLRDDIYGNSHWRQDVTSQKRTLEVTLEGHRANTYLRSAYLNHKNVALVIKWGRGASSLTATMPVCRLRRYNPDNVREPVELQPLKTVGGADSIVWT